VFIGKYPLKYIIVGSGILFLFFLFLLPKLFRFSLFSRVTTWESRIENFSTDKPDEDDYQIEKAKIAIASGKIYGLGPCSEELLPQSSSDFIYAIIVEEYGLIGGFGVLILFIALVSICCSLAQSQYAL
jgi:cell division protein FtsW